MSATTWLIIATVGFSLAGVALIVAIFIFIKLNIPSVIGDLTGKTVAREIKAMKEFNNSSANRKYRANDNLNIDREKVANDLLQGKNDRKIMGEAHLSKRLDLNDESLNFKQDNKKVNSYSEQLTYNSEITDVINNDTEVIDTDRTELLRDNSTDVLNDNPTEMLRNETTEVLKEAETELLNDNPTEMLRNDATEVLEEGATEVLNRDSTQVLNYNNPQENGTTVLSNDTTVLENRQNEKAEVPSVVKFRVTKSEMLIHTDEVI